MALNISDSFCEAVDQIVTARMQEVKFDKTIVCTVESAEDAETTHYYTVSEGLAKFSAYSEQTYKEGSQVLVLIPQGDYNGQKTIIGLYQSKDETGYTFLDLSQRFVPLTYRDGPVQEDNFERKEIVSSEKVETVATLGNWDLTKIETSTCTHLYIRAEFQTNIPQAEVGNYGINLTLTLSNNSRVLYTWDSSYYFGNPYNFPTFFIQEDIKDISTLGLDIQDIKVELYNKNNFKDISDKPINNYTIAVRNLSLSLGYLSQDTQTDSLKLTGTKEEDKYYITNTEFIEFEEKFNNVMTREIQVEIDGQKETLLVGPSKSVIMDTNSSPKHELYPYNKYLIYFTQEEAEQYGLKDIKDCLKSHNILSRKLNVSWTHIDEKGKANTYSQKTYKPDPPKAGEEEPIPLPSLPTEDADTITIIRWFCGNDKLFNVNKNKNINWGNEYSDGVETASDSIFGWPVPSLDTVFGAEFKKIIPKETIDRIGQELYPFELPIELSADTTSAPFGAALIPLVKVEVSQENESEPQPEEVQPVAADKKYEWVVNGNVIKTEVFTFSQNTTVTFVTSEETDIPKDVTNVAASDSQKPIEESEVKKEDEQTAPTTTIPKETERKIRTHVLKTAYHYNAVEGSDFSPASTFQVVCQFSTTYYEQDKVKIVVDRGDGKSDTIVATLTMADGSNALTGAFVAGTLGLLLVHKENSDIPGDKNIIQLPYIMTQPVPYPEEQSKE